MFCSVSMERKKIRGTHFFVEMIVATVLSLVSASLWTDLFRSFIAKNYADKPLILFLICLAVTIFAILILKHLFSEIPVNEEGYIRDNIVNA